MADRCKAARALVVVSEAGGDVVIPGLIVSRVALFIGEKAPTPYKMGLSAPSLVFFSQTEELVRTLVDLVIVRYHDVWDECPFFDASLTTLDGQQ